METTTLSSQGIIARPERFAGRTLDLTLFAVTRAFDVIGGELWSQRKAARVAAGRWTKVIVIIVSMIRNAEFIRRSIKLSQLSQTPPSSPHHVL